MMFAFSVEYRKTFSNTLSVSHESIRINPIATDVKKIGHSNARIRSIQRAGKNVMYSILISFERLGLFRRGKITVNTDKISLLNKFE